LEDRASKPGELANTASNTPSMPCLMHGVAGGCTSAMFGDLVCGNEPCRLARHTSA
jgi:hypothetical protein